jgi:hypothetical protein
LQRRGGPIELADGKHHNNGVRRPVVTPGQRHVADRRGVGITAATQIATLTVSEPGATGPFAVTIAPSSTAPITVTPTTPQTASSPGGTVTFTAIDYTVTISTGSIG